MHAYNAIQNSLDYIETHLKEDINVEIIAGEGIISILFSASVQPFDKNH